MIQRPTIHAGRITTLTIDCRKAYDSGIGTYIRAAVPRVLRRLRPESVKVLIAPGTRALHDYLDWEEVFFAEVTSKPLHLAEQWTLRQTITPGGIFWATSLAHPLYWRGPLVEPDPDERESR